MSRAYLRVTNWTHYQHYKDRNPPWVKFYRDLNDPRNKLNELPISTRYLFDRCLLLAAEYANAIPNDPELIANHLRMPTKCVREGIDQLVKGRWLSHSKTRRRASKPASKMLASETENREQKELLQQGTAFESKHDDNGFGLEGAILELVAGLPDRDPGTLNVIRSIILKRRLGEGHVRSAIEASRGKGVRSPTKVAIAELQKAAR